MTAVKYRFWDYNRHMKRLSSLREIAGDYVINVHGLNVDDPARSLEGLFG